MLHYRVILIIGVFRFESIRFVAWISPRDCPNDNGIIDCLESDCPADIDGDGLVTIEDLLDVIGSWGDCADPDNCPADLDGTGSVDIEDLLAVISGWGACP